MKTDLLVTLADRNYIRQAKQLFSSVYWNAGWKGDYMLLAHKIPEKELKWFRDKGILVKKCKPLYDKGWGKYSPILLDKFYLFTPEFKKWKNIVYLDADIIVRDSLDKLAEIDYFAAVPELYLNKLIYQFINKKNKDFLDIKKKYDLENLSFNGGVFSFNTKIINKNTFNNLLRFFKKYHNITKYGEQTALNLFFYKKWKKLSLSYNIWPVYLSKYHHIPPKKIKARILHFVKNEYISSCRCWNKNNYFYNEWKENLEKAEFIDLSKKPKRKKKYFFMWEIYFFYIRLSIKAKIISCWNFVYSSFHRFANLFGKFLIKYFPKTYCFLKKIIKKRF